MAAVDRMTTADDVRVVAQAAIDAATAALVADLADATRATADLVHAIAERDATIANLRAQLDT
jgi:hypothetical protein